MFLTKCPLCDSSNIHQVESTVKRKIKGESVFIPSIKYWICPDCGEKIFFSEAMSAMDEYLKQKSETKEVQFT
jgi:YgiT-type zinc finger domain-containing protein